MSAPPSRNRKSLLSSAAVLESWARTPDRAARTRPAFQARMQRLAAEVDPDGTLPPDELARRVDQLLKAQMRRLAARSAQVRAERRAEKTEAPRSANRGAK